MKVLVKTIYSNLLIPPNLQKHMCRVAAMGYYVAKKWDENVDIELVTTCCLLHDIANIIKFDLNKLPHLLENEEKNVKYWKKVQNVFYERYGTDELSAANTILREMGVRKEIIDIIGTVHLTILPDPFSQKRACDEAYIYLYADSRVAPYGIVSINDRVNDLSRRYGKKMVRSGKHKLTLKNITNKLENVERYIQKHAYDIDLTKSAIKKFPIPPKEFLDKKIDIKRSVTMKMKHS